MVEHLGQLDFLHAKENVVLLGPPGTSETPRGRASVVVVDEVGYIPFGSRGHEPDVQLGLGPLQARQLDRDFEQAVSGWGEIFGDEVVAAAMMHPRLRPTRRGKGRRDCPRR